MSSQRVGALAFVFGLGAAAFGACGVDSGGQAGSGWSGAGGAAASDAGGGSASGGTAAGPPGGTAGTGGSIQLDAGGGGSGSGDGSVGDACAADVKKGELVPLDMFVMLDSSGSMLQETSSGPTKWDAVRQALTAFVNDAQVSGMGIGLQFFPLNKAGVPDSCSSNAQCGDGAPCFLKACMPFPGGQLYSCSNDSQCPLTSSCLALGECSNDTTFVCNPAGNCNGPGGPGGPCVPLTSSYCMNATTCLVGDYATAAVPIAALPGAAPAIVGAIDQRSPGGLTPTGPALQGAVDHARGHAQQNVGHRVVVVFATDGLPTECNPTEPAAIAQLAAAAAAGNPSITTFVIGVFAPGEVATARPTLDQIASSGGSNTAFVIDTNQNVAQSFIDAMNAIRGTALACEFQIPQPSAGQTLDFGKVNVDFTSGSTTTGLLYVESAQNCTAQSGGWYYDVDPSQGVPTKILVCPSTCDAFKTATEPEVAVKLGCETIFQPPA
ncbi:MAG: VWA domain-containing protein [Polyangiaceae bacterium]|nr:VWA domain-containing protein [Polyangiaceae bacterium]